MPQKRKRNSKQSFAQQRQRRTHPKNKYAETSPDFGQLAELYPSFKPYVFYSHNGRPGIDWTDYNATRELTRVLLYNDFGVTWWIPDGQLCPTVPNRCNYIHWIEDLLSSNLVSKSGAGNDGAVKGFDIGTGANCIYPLIGAALHGWRFVASDVTEVALEWAQKNVDNNPHLKELIEIRDAGICDGERIKDDTCTQKPEDLFEPKCSEALNNCTDMLPKDSFQLPSSDQPNAVSENKSNFDCSDNASSCKMDKCSENLSSQSTIECSKTYSGPSILVNVIKEKEEFDFCMCNPPFFENISDAGANPRTACGGTMEEMVCPGGEQAFIKHIIDDSVQIKERIRWYTVMVGRKVNLKVLTGYLHKAGAKIVQTTEFVQGRTSRWGLAWSFLPSPRINFGICSVKPKTELSFMIEGLQQNYSAFHVLQSVEQFFLSQGALCNVDLPSFTINVTLRNMDHGNGTHSFSGSDDVNCTDNIRCGTSKDVPEMKHSPKWLSVRVSIFQQAPGTLLLKGSLTQKDNALSEAFFGLFFCLKDDLKKRFSVKLV